MSKKVTSISEIRQQIAESLSQNKKTKIVTVTSGNTYEIRRLSPVSGLKFGLAIGASNIISQRQQNRGAGAIIDSDQIEKYFLMVLEEGLVEPALEKEEIPQFVEALPNDAVELFSEIMAMSQGKQVIDLEPFRSE